MSRESVYVIVYSSRCLYCGRLRPHECCHEHSEAVNPGWFTAKTDIDALWDGNQEPETCADPACPVWEPGEWDAFQAAEERRVERRRSTAGEGVTDE